MLCSVTPKNAIQYLGFHVVTLKFGLLCVLSKLACMYVLTYATATCTPKWVGGGKLTADCDILDSCEKVAWPPKIHDVPRPALNMSLHYSVKLASTLWWFTAAPKPLKIQVFWGSPSPQGSHSPYILGDTTRPGHVTCVLV